MQITGAFFQNNWCLAEIQIADIPNTKCNATYDLRFFSAQWVRNSIESNKPMSPNYEDKFEILQVGLTLFFPPYFVYDFQFLIPLLGRNPSDQ
jgi:hypothetical protein